MGSQVCQLIADLVMAVGDESTFLATQCMTDRESLATAIALGRKVRKLPVILDEQVVLKFSSRQGGAIGCIGFLVYFGFRGELEAIYLASHFDSFEVRRRINLAQKTFRDMEPIFKDRKINKKLHAS